MMSHPNRTRRIWTTPSGTVCLRDDIYPINEGTIREFWVPSNGGYVREIDEANPGTLGRQVCERLGHCGSTLSAHPDSLLALVKREYRRACARKKAWY